MCFRRRANVRCTCISSYGIQLRDLITRSPEMALYIVEVLEERTGLPAVPLSCLVQGASNLLAVVFWGISLSKYDGGSLQTSVSLSIFLSLLSIFTVCASFIAIVGNRQDRSSIPNTRYLKEKKGHPAIVLWTVVVLVMNFLCQATMVKGLNIRWEFTEILAAVFNSAYVIASLFTVVVIVQKRV